MSDDDPDRGTANSTAPAEDRGLRCRICQCRDFFVVYTRARPGGRIVRRRECRHCGARLTTVERAA